MNSSECLNTAYFELIKCEDTFSEMDKTQIQLKFVPAGTSSEMIYEGDCLMSVFCDGENKTESEIQCSTEPLSNHLSEDEDCYDSDFSDFDAGGRCCALDGAMLALIERECDFDRVPLERQTAVRLPQKSLHFPDARERSRINWSTFSVRDGNPVKNTSALARMWSGGQSEKLYGSTRFGSYSFNFPVYCKARVFKDFLDALDKVDSFDRRLLIRDGILTRRLFVKFRHVFRPLGGVLGTMQDTMSMLSMWALIGLCMQGMNVFSFMSEKWIELIVFIIALIYNLGVVESGYPKNWYEMLSHVFVEEIFKHLFGAYYFALSEYSNKISMCGFGPVGLIALLPFGMHVGISYVPLLWRPWLHFSWNIIMPHVVAYFADYLQFYPGTWIPIAFLPKDHDFFLAREWHQMPVAVYPEEVISRRMFRNVSYAVPVDAYSVYTKEQMARILDVCRTGVLGMISAPKMMMTDSLLNSLSSVEEVSFAVDFLIKIYRCDVAGMLCSVGMRATYFHNISKMWNLSVDDFIAFSKAETRPRMVDIAARWNLPVTTTLSGETETKVGSLLDKIAPEWFTKSPTTRRIAGLAVMLASAPFFAESHLVQSFGNLVDWTGLVEGASVFETCFSALRAVYDAMMRVPTAASFRDIFALPGEVKFITESWKLLNSENDPDSQEVVLEKIAKARHLLDTRMYKVPGPQISRLIEKLNNYVVKRTALVDSTNFRLLPMAIWLNGEPGAGKTILIENIINMLSKRHGLERFLGDVITYNINDKYPASTGAHPKARFVVLNDIPSVYLNFPNMDLLALDIVLQKLLDTAPMDVRAAAVEDKGVVFNDIKYVIITANHDCYRCPGETPKLQRRLEDGVLVKVSMETASGKKLKYSDTVPMSQGERNDCVKFTPTVVECTEMHIKFSPTLVKYGMNDFLNYVCRRSDDHFVRAQSAFDKFSDPKSRCDCGIAASLHFTGEHKVFRCRTPACMRFAKEAEYVAYIGPEVVDEPLSFPAVVYNVTYFAVSWAAFLVFITCVFMYAIDVYDKVLLEVGRRVVKNIEFRLVCHPGVDTAVRYYAQLSNRPEEIPLLFRMYRAYLKLRDFVIRHGQKIAAAFVLGGVGLVLRSQITTNPSGNAIFRDQVDESSMEVVSFDREPNYTPSTARKWNKVEAEMTTAKLATLGVSAADLILKCKVATAKSHISFPDDQDGLDCEVFVLGPEALVLCKHFIAPGGISKGRFYLTLDGIRVQYETSDVFYFPDKEFIMLKNHHRPFAPSLHKFLPESLPGTSHNVTVVLREGSTSVVAKTSKCTLYRGTPHEEEYLDTIEWPMFPKEGTCASPVVVHFRDGACIGSVISYGTKYPGPIQTFSVVGGCKLLQSDYAKFCARTPFPVTDVLALGTLPELGPLSENAEVRNTCTPFLLPLGSTSAVGSSFHSSIKKSMFYETVSKKLSVEYAIPNRLRGLDDRGEYKSAWIQTFTNVNLQCDAPEGLWTRAAYAYVNDVVPVENLVTKKVTFRPLTLPEAIFGDPKIGVDRITFKTSLGPKLRAMGMKNKFDVFSQDESGFYYLRPEVKFDIARLIDLIRKGILPVVLLDFSPKDEVRPKEKIDRFKIRLFSVMDFHLNIVCRMFCMPIITYLLGLPFLSECFGQMNAGSREWTNLANYLIAKGGLVFDMDFSSFDTSHHSLAFEAVAKVFYLVALRLHYEQWEAEFVYHMVLVLKVQLLRYLTDYVIKTKGLPSGYVLTLILNSIVNSLLMRMAFEVLVGLSMKEFKKHVHAATVGDDNASGVSAEVSERYNMLTIAPLYKSWGYVATPASKSGALQKFLSLSDLTFLKRRFLFDAELGFYMAPIECDSIYKALCFESMEKGVSSAQRLVDVAANCQRESFLHGKKFFDEMVAYLKETFDKHQMLHVFLELQYVDLQTEFLEGTFRTIAC